MVRLSEPRGERMTPPGNFEDEGNLYGWEKWRQEQSMARFREQLPAMCRHQGLNPNPLEFNDYVKLVAGWLFINPR